MLDLSKLTETIAGLLGGVDSRLDISAMAEMLSAAGIEPQMLDGLTGPEIQELLQSYGIDPASIDMGALSQFMESSGLSAFDLGDVWKR